ncbi:MAG: DUF6318 family protein [Janibacter sp.]|nr:DUF6318 family protein [Janibacter sp.]
MPSDLPDAAREETKAGAAAFGKYYYETFGNATDSGQTGDLEKLSADECKVCSTSVSGIQADMKKGWTRSENPYSITNVKAQKRSDSGYKVSMSVKVAAHTREDANGKENGHVKATTYTLTQHVAWENDRWQMLDWIVT